MEAFLFDSGRDLRLGRVDDGTTTTDFEPEEMKRKVTINAALAPCEWKEHKLDLLIRPVMPILYRRLKALCGLSTVSWWWYAPYRAWKWKPKRFWQYAQDLNKPSLLFVNKMDRKNADFFAVLEQIRASFGSRAVPVQIPIGSQETFRGIVDLLTMKAFFGQSGGHAGERRGCSGRGYGAGDTRPGSNLSSVRRKR